MGYRNKGHRRKHDPKYAEDYADMFRHIRKWINQCVVCQQVGHKADLPIGSSSRDIHIFDNIKKYWEPLVINELGLCEVCERNLGKE